MTCPAGCVREKGHDGFHTTHPEIAEREDRAEYDRFMAELNAAYDWKPVAPGLSVGVPKVQP